MEKSQDILSVECFAFVKIAPVVKNEHFCHLGSIISHLQEGPSGGNTGVDVPGSAM